MRLKKRYHHDMMVKETEAIPIAGKDITEKNLEAYNDVFADIVNVLLFNGKSVLKEDALVGSGAEGGL